jgi:hypothetical protein
MPFDIHFQALLEQEQLATFKFVGFGYSPAIGVKGFQMLINHWVKCFLTPRGSDPTDLNNGTDFVKLIGSNLSTENARDVTAIAVEQCNDQINVAQRDDSTLTATELLASAQIVQFVEAPSAPGFHVYIELKNQANERLVLNVPTAALSE